MKKLLVAGLGLALLAGAFYAGFSYARRPGEPVQVTGGRKVLYYVDPMNPSHTSDQPGLAPCGMKMEPVYADEMTGAAPLIGLAKEAPGTIRLTPAKRQLTGVEIGVVEKKPCKYTLRLLGRVVPDETRVYKINAAVGGWITKAPPIPTWSRVQSNDVLGEMYSPEFLPAAQALLFALDAKDRAEATEKAGGQESAEYAAAQRTFRASRRSQFDLNLKQYVDSLKNLGMGEPQVQEMIRTHRFTENFQIFAPGSGFITFRNLSEGQRFERGAELYRIADLSRVWVVADLFEKDAPSIEPGSEARVRLPHQSRTLLATVSRTLPEFNAASRTLKLRLELDNPEFVLKPEMFVDVEFPLTTSEEVMVPASAVLDAGLRKAVFVERAAGVFEPRQIEVGRQYGDQVEVLQGLAPGERIVVSGNFLLDSESRMKLAATGTQQPAALDPVCGMNIDATVAKETKLVSEHAGKTYYFCNEGCKRKFDAKPTKFIKEPPPKAGMAMAGEGGGDQPKP